MIDTLGVAVAYLLWLACDWLEDARDKLLIVAGKAAGL